MLKLYLTYHNVLFIKIKHMHIPLTYRCTTLKLNSSEVIFKDDYILFPPVLIIKMLTCDKSNINFFMWHFHICLKQSYLIFEDLRLLRFPVIHLCFLYSSYNSYILSYKWRHKQRNYKNTSISLICLVFFLSILF